MKKVISGLILSLLLTLLPSVSSYAVLFGQNATGDPNAVKVRGGSGFLYSERIILTVAHVIDTSGGVAEWEREGVIYNPGIVTIAGERTYKVKKVLIPSSYSKPDFEKGIQGVDDLAVIILNEDMPVTKKASMATEEQLVRFVAEKSKVELVGYGMTDGSQKNAQWGERINRAPNKLTSTLLSPKLVVESYKQYPNVDWRKIENSGVYGVAQDTKLRQGHICDGDSGAAFFVEEDNVRYVLGTTGLGITNDCSPPEGGYGLPSISLIDPASKLKDLLRTAEKIVEEDKKAESLKAKAALSKKVSITCIKGKQTKKITALKPKCPAGYKKK
jgi:secreted trypsin-like serine protease